MENSNKKRNCKIVSVVCPKGGIGKSTITAHMATIINYLNKGKDYKVGILDADFLQRNIYKKRKKEELQLKNDERFQDMVHRYGIETYTIETTQEEHLIEIIKEMKEEHDLLFVDFPGTLTNRTILRALLEINFILIPFFPEEFEEDTTMSFITEIIPILKKKENYKDAAVIFNKYTGSHDNMNINPYDEMKEKLDKIEFKYFDSKIYKRDDFQNHKSTILPIKPNAKDKASFYYVVQEFLKFIN